MNDHARHTDRRAPGGGTTTVATHQAAQAHHDGYGAAAPRAAAVAPVPSVRRAAPLGAMLALAVVLAACGATATPATTAGEAATRRSDGGQVAVAVTWAGRAAGPVFRVVLETHAVELDGYDLRQLAVLRTEQGREVRPSGWDAPPGGHHREGTLTFPAALADGGPALGPPTGPIELVIRDVAGVPERVFRWAP